MYNGCWQVHDFDLKVSMTVHSTFVNLFNQVEDQENYNVSKETHQLFLNKSLQMRLFLQTVAMKAVISYCKFKKWIL